MHDGAVPTSRIITIALWSLTTAAYAAAVISCIAGRPHLATLLGFAACCLSAAAAVSSIRCMTLKAVRYVVANTAARDSGSPGLHGL